MSALADAQRRTRRKLPALWFPLVLFGSLTLFSSVLHLAGGAIAGLFWAGAGPLGGIATGRYYATHPPDPAFPRPPLPYIAVAAGITIGAFLVSAFTSGNLRDVGPHFAVAAGHVGFAWIERDGRVAALAAVIAAVPILLLAIDPDAAGAVTAALNGSIMLASGLAFRPLPASS